MRISVPTTKSCKRKGCSLRGGGFLRFGEELATEAKGAQPGGAKPRPHRPKGPGARPQGARGRGGAPQLRRRWGPCRK